MALLDRLLPAWRHSDPEVRASAVRELGSDSGDVLASIARDDGDVRVRRLAVKKLDDPDVLREVGLNDADEDLRHLATTRAEHLFVERALSDGPQEECLKALDTLARPTHLVTIATRAAHPDVRRAALSQLGDAPSLAEVARRSDDPNVGLEALERVADPALLHRVVTGATASEVALAALARIEQPEVLQEISEDQQAHKNVRKRAAAMLEAVLSDDHPIRAAARRERQVQLCVAVEGLSDVTDSGAALIALRDAEGEWHDLSQRTAADPGVGERFRQACESARSAIVRAENAHAEERRREAAHLERLAKQQQICEAVEALQGADTPQGIEVAQAAWREIQSFDDPQGRDLSVRFTAAVERCMQRYERWRLRDEFRTQLEALVNDAERLVASGDPQAAARPREALEKRWAQIASSPAGTKWLADERALQRRFFDAGEALKERVQSLRADREERVREARHTVHTLCRRLEQLAQADAVSQAAADRAFTAAADAEDHLRALPAAERDALRHRLIVGRQTLARRVEESVSAEDWKRWANRDAQQRLIERAESLLAADDARQMLREIGKLDQEWKGVAVAPRDQSQALWDRFRRARNELRRRTAAYLADNLAKKEALCVAVEQLADSTDWKVTAEAIRRMQEEWKQIGPVRQKLSASLFDRFRAPANRFFARQKEFHQARKAQRDELLSRMRALCEETEALADSTDWDVTAEQIKRLQARAQEIWGRGRPPRRNAEAPRPGDVLRDRFRAACDRFFDRYRRRGDLELEAKLSAAETIVADLESLVTELAAAEPPTAEAFLPRLKERLSEWSRGGSVPAAHLHALTQRLQTACDAIEAACPDAISESDLDIESDVRQREKLCVRLERVASSLAAEASEPAPSDLAERLKLALAARTIGGTATPPREQMRRDAIETAARMKEKWRRLGPVIGPKPRSLAVRFEKAVAEIESSVSRRIP